MADEQAAPYNTDAMAAMVRDSVKSAVTDLQAQHQQAQQQQVAQAQQQRAAQQQWSDPVAQTVRPYIEPALQAMNLQVMAANDRSDFYLSNPDAVAYRPQVEAMFQQKMADGQPMQREALWYHYIGRNREAFNQRDAERQAQQTAAAQRQFATVGGPSALRQGGPDLEQFKSLPLDQMRDALKGVSF